MRTIFDYNHILHEAFDRVSSFLAMLVPSDRPVRTVLITFEIPEGIEIITDVEVAILTDVSESALITILETSLQKIKDLPSLDRSQLN